VRLRRIDRLPEQGARTWWCRSRRGQRRGSALRNAATSEAYLDAYIKAAGGCDDGKAPLFRSAAGRTGALTENPMNRVDAWRMMYLTRALWFSS
jgi:hypothetical protein